MIAFARSDRRGWPRGCVCAVAASMHSAITRPDEGPNVDWFVDRYRSAVGADPPYPAAQSFAAGVLAARCLRDAKSVDDAAQLAVARHLACRTLYGDFRLDPATGLQVGHRVVTVQWQQGRRRAIWPPELAEAALRYPLEGVERADT